MIGRASELDLDKVRQLRSMTDDAKELVLRLMALWRGRGRRLKPYRLYFMDEQDHIRSGVVLQCANEEEAVRDAMESGVGGEIRRR
jgi:hypothetical protein